MKAQLFSAAAFALSAFAAVPAGAQVSGIAVADPAIAIARSQAFQTANQQIGTTYQAQRTQLEQLDQQRIASLRVFDTNNDGQLSQPEQTAAQANTTAVAQLQTIDQQIEQIQSPITAARVYVVEQIAVQLSAAVRQLVTDKSIQLILSPSATLFVADPVDVSDDITTVLNTSVPTVSIAVPAGWQPNQQTVALYQQIQELLAAAQAQQQAAAAQQPAAPAVQGR